MARRRFALPSALVALALVAAACADSGLRVGDDSFSQSRVFDELDTLGPLVDPEGELTAGELADSYDQEFVSAVLQQRIELTLAEQLFDTRGLELGDAERSESEAQLLAQFGPAFDGLSAGDRQSLVDDVARMIVLERELGQDGRDAALAELAAEADISVSSRFGQWDDERRLVVPPGAATPPGDDRDRG